MVKYLLTLVLLFSVEVAQTQNLPDFYTPQTKSCPLDSNVSVRGFANWEAYQTLDDTWNGPRDSSSCFNFAPTPNVLNKAIIKFADVDPTKTVFVRALFSPKLLQEDGLYHFEAYFSASGNNVISLADTCVEGICSGISVAVSVPDSAGTGVNYRWYQGASNNGFCIPTEAFIDGNKLAEIIYRFKYTGTSGNDSVIMYSPYMSNYYYYNQVYGPLIATPHAGGRYQYRFDERQDYYYSSSYLFMYNLANGYPDHSNLSYMEVMPDPNPAVVDTIDVVMGESQFDPSSYIFQPHTRMQASHPDGDTVNRHVLNIINNGANLCLNTFYEKGFEKGAKYEHHAGEVNFNDARTCFLFGEGGKLVVADGANFQYGQSGRGMMALKSGGTIEIGKGAELLVGGTITMFEYEWETQSNQIYMELNEGSKLTFLPGSRITNMQSKFGKIKLNIYMNGGLLDDSGLQPEDKRLVNLIYPAPKRYLEENVAIVPNPVEGHIRISYNTKADTELQLTVLDINGKTVFVTTKQAFEGMNFLETDALNLPAGTYILRIQSGDETAVKRFVLM
jgi:hypothetical protein